MKDNSEYKLFLDKNKLSSIALEKETRMIEAYSTFLQKVNQKFIDQNKFRVSTTYHDTVSCMFELWSFIEFNKVRALEEENVMKCPDLREIMTQHKGGAILTFKNVTTVYDDLRFLMSLSGYHDDTLDQRNEVGLMDEGS